MAKSSKRTVKFLRAAGKAGSKGGAKAGDTSFKKGGRSKPRKDKQDKDDVLEDMEVETVISMKNSKNNIPPGKKSVTAKPKKGSVGTHKDELQSLQDKDPEFFKYLQANDANLLHFGDDDENEDLEGELEEDDDDMDFSDEEGEGVEEDDDDDEEEGAIPASGRRAKRESGSVEVTEILLNKTVENAQEGSFPALKKLLSIFRAACLPANDKDNDDEDNVDQSASTFIIPSPEIYQLVMIAVTENAHIAMYKHLDLEELSTENLSKIEKHPRWKKLQFMVLSYYKSMLHTLNSLAVASKQEQVSVFLITSLEAYLPLLSPMPRLTRAVLKSLLVLWSQGMAPIDGEADVRVHAFLRIRQMALILPGTVREECFRSIYLRYARGCKSVSQTGGSSVVFMAQCVAELFTLDPVQAYQQAFLYIRQLALHLRAALVKKTSEATRQVTTWQFLNCLRLWTRVICTMPDKDLLGPLIFPLAQIMFGVMAAAPSIYFIPLRFHLITCLHQLAASGRVFIPTASRLAEILEHPDLIAKPTPSTDLAPNIQYLVRLPSDSVLKVAVRDLLVSEVITLLRHDAEIYRYHVGLPEYSYLTIRKLRAFGKKTKINKWRDLCRTLAGQLEDHSSFAKLHRIKLGQSPMQITQFEPLLPSDHPMASIRLLKLLAGRGLEKVNEVIVGHDYHTGKGGKGEKGDIKEGDDIDDDEEDEEEEEGEEVDMEVSDEDSSVEGNNDTDDKIVGLQWSDDDE